MNKIIHLAALLILIGVIPAFCGEKADLFKAVAALDITCQGYTLCAPLSPEQQAHAAKNMQEANAKKVYRFQDNHLNIVADRDTHRVLVMFEQFENIGQQEVQDMVGDLFVTYGDPTVSAHDKVVYWAWGKQDKFTAEQYKAAKETKTQLEIIATLKLNSEVKIMAKGQAPSKGNMYYIISSDPLLRFFKDD